MLYIIVFYCLQYTFFPGLTTRVITQIMLFLVLLIVFSIKFNHIKQIKFEGKNYLISFLFYSIIIYIYSIFISKSYEQWRYLIADYTPVLLLPVIGIISSGSYSPIYQVRTLIKYITLLSLFNLLNKDLGKIENVHFVDFMSYNYLLILFLPYFKFKYKIIIIAISIATVLLNLDNRSNIIFTIISFLIMSIYYVPYLLQISKTLRKLLQYIPIVLFLLGILGIVNIFQYLENEFIYNYSTGISEINITTDSRTSIYLDAIDNLNENNAWIWGTGVTNIYKTRISEGFEGYDKGRMGASESGFLNLISFGGFIYVIIFFLIILKSSYLAIYRSNNKISKLLGIFVSFAWFFIFIEIPIGFKMVWYIFFISIGICLNPNFRGLNDAKIKLYLNR